MIVRLTVVVGFDASGSVSTCRPFGSAYSVMPSTDVTRVMPAGSRIVAAGAAAAGACDAAGSDNAASGSAQTRAVTRERSAARTAEGRARRCMRSPGIGAGPASKAARAGAIGRARAGAILGTRAGAVCPPSGFGDPSDEAGRSGRGRPGGPLQCAAADSIDSAAGTSFATTANVARVPRRSFPMPVQLRAPDPERIRPVAGIELGFAEAGIRKANRRDLMVMRIAPGSRVAGVFTQNGFAAAPVQVCRRHLSSSDEIRALVVNAGNANCGTGDDGIAAALRTCEVVAHLAGCSISQVLPFSTGVILEPLPVARIEAALPAAFATLAADRWADAASAIMTTDTVAKAASRTIELDGATITVTGIAKGVGMLQPDMATMLAFVATDAAIEHAALQRLVREVADQSFNRVTVDGDTSTNDSFVLVATGAAKGASVMEAEPRRYDAMRSAIVDVAQTLAQSIARDGEGATKFITIRVDGAAGGGEAVRVARSIANSPLVKTALFASDPNLGRLLMAIGNAGIADLDTTRVNLWLSAGDDEVRVIDGGRRAPSYAEEDGARVMKPDEIVIRVDLGRGDASTVVWTCDFSYDYVKINAEYRT